MSFVAMTTYRRTRNVSECLYSLYAWLQVTYRVSRRRRKMYLGHARLCMCLCVCRSPHYCMDPRFNVAGLKVGRVADPAHFDLPRLYRVSLGSNFTKDKFLENACQNASR